MSLRDSLNLIGHLQLDGPCSIARLIRATGWPREKVLRVMFVLRTAGTAQRLCLRRYGLTDKGRKVYRDFFKSPRLFGEL